MRRGARRGVAALEFGLLAPVLVTLFCAILEYSFQELTAATLDMGMREASRFGATGALKPDWLTGTPPATREEAIRRVVLHYGSPVLKSEGLVISTTLLSNAGRNTAGGSGDLVLYRLDYTQPFLTPLAVLVTGRRATAHHRSTTVIRNEPFPTS
ncbi:TadE/TadG family type IV pilus assembly protein [Roseomonas sp. BN140053]|uniref:TadE/TadG family type IV pilus assembly protein n=1 Tax=Roseomonas sp. BN140053 TaxID=3391898 RepID=UPI0039EB28D2